MRGITYISYMLVTSIICYMYVYVFVFINIMNFISIFEYSYLKIIYTTFRWVFGTKPDDMMMSKIPNEICKEFINSHYKIVRRKDVKKYINKPFYCY